MAAEDEIPKWYQSQFTQNVELQVQKMGSLLQDLVDQGDYKGQSAEVVKQFGPTVARIGDNSRFGDTPIMSTPRDQRWVYPTLIDWGDLFDRIDLMQQLLDPTSKLTMNAGMAMGRATDTIIISAARGAAKTGTAGGTSTIYDVTQDVANTVGSAGGATPTGMNVAKLIRARRILRHNYVNFKAEPLICVIGAEQEEELFNDDKFVSTRYRREATLEDGDMNEFFKVMFVVLEELSKSGNDRQCLFFVKSGLHLGKWETLTTHIAPNPAKKFNQQLYMHQYQGATRTQEKKVAGILCTES